MNKGICFLDIDGVVNTRILEYENGKFTFKFIQAEEGKVNNKMALLYLSKLCIENNLDIYIMSNWLNIISYDEICETLYDSGLIKDVKFIKPKNDSLNKGFEIKNFLEEHPEYKEKYVILDDIIGYYETNPDLCEHVVLCSDDYGFTGINMYHEAVDILNKKAKEKVLK